GRDDVPRRMLCCSSANRLFVRRLIVVPALTFLEILGIEFPVLFGLFEPLEKPLFLFLFRDVQEELPDEHAVAREILLDVADVLESMLPQLFVVQERCRHFLSREELRVDSNDDHFLVIGAVEDANPAALRQHAETTPQAIVVEIVRGGDAKGVHLTPLWIDARHHVLDGAVFSSRIDGLKNQEHRPPILGVEPLLHLGGGLDTGCQQVLGNALVLPLEPARIGRVDVLQPEAAPIADAIPFRKLSRAPNNRLEFHQGSSLETDTGSGTAGALEGYVLKVRL